MQADAETAEAIRELVERTYRALSTPGAEFDETFGHPDMVAVGSGQGELFGPDVVVGTANYLATLGFTWVSDELDVWRHGDVAWARILGHTYVITDGVTDHVPYGTTAVFCLESGEWCWVFWGGAEPQENPRV